MLPPCPPPLARRVATALLRRAPAAVIALVALAGGCAEPEPVLRGVQAQPLLEAPAPAASAPEETTVYERPPGVLVDIQHLTSRPLAQVRVALRAQLGALVRAEALPAGRGEELVLERGRVRALDGRIYMLAFDTPEPMRRAQVMAALGLPPQVGESVPTHREYRLNHERGFRLIRMMRQSRHNELVTAVEVWKWRPGEHTNRR